MKKYIKLFDTYINENYDYKSSTYSELAEMLCKKYGYEFFNSSESGTQGHAFFIRKNGKLLVLKITTDFTEYKCATKLLGIESEYFATIYKTVDLSEYGYKLYGIFLEYINSLPIEYYNLSDINFNKTKEEFMDSNKRYFSEYTTPELASDYYDRILEIRNFLIKLGIKPVDLIPTNFGLKNDKIAVFDIGDIS